MSNLIPSQGTNIVSRREDRAVARHLSRLDQSKEIGLAQIEAEAQLEAAKVQAVAYVGTQAKHAIATDRERTGQMSEFREFEGGVPPSCDVTHWLGVKFEGLDCEGWLPYMGAEEVGMDSGRKITIPEPVSQTAEVVPFVLPDMCCVYNECASKVVV